MTFDPRSLLTAPLTDLTVDGLAAALVQLQAAGFGEAGVKLPGGAPVRKINLVAHGEQAAHFVLTDGVPATTGSGTLGEAIAIASKAHAGQFDKGGAPYILHPLRVMARVATEGEKIVAVLHDVVEDSGGAVTFESLTRAGFSAEIVDALRSVTKIAGETYDDFVARAAEDPIGKIVKLADLAENSDLSRIPNPSPKDFERLEKYRRATRYLLAN